MTRIAYWSHYPLESRSAAGQRTRSFVAKLRAQGRTVVLLGEGSAPAGNKWLRLAAEAWATLTARAPVQIITLPPYRSALVQAALVPLMPARRLILDQRDMALDSSPRLERLLERLLVRRADALIVTTNAQRRAMLRRHGRLPRTILIRNGASDDLTTDSAPRPRSVDFGRGRPRVLYQGLVGGKKLAEVARRLSAMGCDLDLAVFLDVYSAGEVDLIRQSWDGPGTLEVHANLDAASLARLMDRADVAINPVPDQMDYAFTVKTADYAVRGLPQLVMGKKSSVSRRAVELCRLGHAIDGVEALDRAALERAVERFRRRGPDELRVFRRETHAPRILQLLREMEK